MAKKVLMCLFLIMILILCGCSNQNVVTLSNEEYNELVSKRDVLIEFTNTIENEINSGSLVLKDEISEKKQQLENDIAIIEEQIYSVKNTTSCDSIIEGDYRSLSKLHHESENLDSELFGVFASEDFEKIIIFYSNGVALKGHYYEGAYTFTTFKYTTENHILNFFPKYVIGTGCDTSTYTIEGNKLTLDYYNEYADEEDNAHTYEFYTKIGSDKQ